jgi:dCMP deaminase
MDVADVIGRRSRCIRRQAGCVLVTADNHVVATGYNGPPRGMQVHGSCDQWCPRATSGGSLSYDDDLAVHAETNALLRADASLLDKGVAYVNTCPCFTCAKNLANSGILLVICRIGPEDVDRQPERSLNLLRRSDIGVMVQRDDGAFVTWTG